MSFKHTATQARVLLRSANAAQRTLPQQMYASAPLDAPPTRPVGTREYSGVKLTGNEAVGIATSSDFSFPALAARVASLEAAHDFQITNSNAELSRSLRRRAIAPRPVQPETVDLFPRDLESSILKNLARAGHHETFEKVRARYFADARRKLSNAKILQPGQAYHEHGKRVVRLLLQHGCISEEVYFAAAGREVGMRMLDGNVFELDLDSREISFTSTVMREFCKREKALWV